MLLQEILASDNVAEYVLPNVLAMMVCEYVAAARCKGEVLMH